MCGLINCYTYWVNERFVFHSEIQLVFFVLNSKYSPFLWDEFLVEWIKFALFRGQAIKFVRDVRFAILSSSKAVKLWLNKKKTEINALYLLTELNFLLKVFFSTVRLIDNNLVFIIGYITFWKWLEKG